MVNFSFFLLLQGPWFISQRVAASFLAETDATAAVAGESFPFAPVPASPIETGGGVVVSHMGAGVVEPPRFPIRIARLNLYFLTSEDDEDDEQLRFLILHLVSGFGQGIVVVEYEVVQAVWKAGKNAGKI